jgi:hypothetical protein
MIFAKSLRFVTVNVTRTILVIGRLSSHMSCRPSLRVTHGHPTLTAVLRRDNEELGVESTRSDRNRNFTASKNE